MGKGLAGGRESERNRGEQSEEESSQVHYLFPMATVSTKQAPAEEGEKSLTITGNCKFLLLHNIEYFSYKNEKLGEIPGGPVVRTLCFHNRGHGFDPCPWLRN